MQFIDLSAQQKRIRDKIEARINHVLDHGQYIMGPEVKELEEQLSAFVGVNHCISCSSGTDALLMALMALDIGPRTSDLFRKEIEGAATIVWNGPMGVFETELFKNGTRNIARAVGASKAFSVVGGGDTVRAVHQFGVSDRISYISTGGGAFMEYMEGKTLPGVAALEMD